MNTSAHYTIKQFDPPPLPPPHKKREEKKKRRKTKKKKRKKEEEEEKKQSRSVHVYLQPHQTIAVFHQTCYIYRASTTHAQSTRLFNTYVIMFDTADTYGLVIYPKHRINSF